MLSSKGEKITERWESIQGSVVKDINQTAVLGPIFPFSSCCAEDKIIRLSVDWLIFLVVLGETRSKHCTLRSKTSMAQTGSQPLTHLLLKGGGEQKHLRQARRVLICTGDGCLNQYAEAVGNLLAILRLEWWKFNALQMKLCCLWGWLVCFWSHCSKE